MTNNRSDQETIRCAAIYVDDGLDHQRMSYSYPETGLVFCGWRHSDCFTTLRAWMHGLTAEEIRRIGCEQIAGKLQGFLTSTGRFVDRVEAAMIARNAGQIASKTESLDSEDLY